MERGRDYGEPSYNKFRQLCGLKEVKTFNDLIDQMDKKVRDLTSEILDYSIRYAFMGTHELRIK